ncbi:peptidase S8/S53 domain-containing protein [Trichoderma compactum]
MSPSTEEETWGSLQLFREKEDEDDVDDDEPGVDWAPYYDFSSEQMAAEDSKEKLPAGQFLHRYPRVLALGAILYELGQKKRERKPTKASALRSSTDPTNPPTIEKRVNDAVFKIRKRVQNKGWPDIGLKEIQIVEDYRAIVANCVSKDLFRLDLKETSQNSWSQYFVGTTEELEEVFPVSERRAIIFRTIVAPLKEMVQSAGWADQLGNIQRSQVAGEIARLKAEILVSEKPRSVAALNDTTLVSQISPYGTQNGQTGSRSKAEVWLNKIKGAQVTEEVVSAFRKKELTTSRIRIVVLDTGYDPDAKDFVEENQPKAKDENGHGTHILSVLMKVAPAADVFMARIARDTQDLPNATENIAAANMIKAIKWAWKECKANIVNMSFGFEEEILVNEKRIISNAINSALEGTDQRILFFAAAANHGGNEEEMFPASNPNVFSIRGCDADGCALGFNPPLGRNANIYFMTLGLDIPGPSLAKSKDGGADVYKSGTSVATPIAAGIAAMLLGYARIHEEQLQQRLGDHDESKLSRLWKIFGMTELFKKILPETENKLVYLNLHRFICYSHEMRLVKIESAVTDTRG